MDEEFSPQQIAAWMKQLQRETTEKVPGLKWLPNEQTDSCYLTGTRIGILQDGVRHVNVMSQNTVGDFILRDNFHQLQDRPDALADDDEAGFDAIKIFRISLEKHLDADIRSIGGKDVNTRRARHLKKAAHFHLEDVIDNMDGLIKALCKLRGDLS